MSGCGAADRDRIIGSVCAQPHRFGLPGRPRPESVAVRLLGSGESYTAWLVEPAGTADDPDGAPARGPVVVPVRLSA